MQKKVIRTDVLVVGAGMAGLMAAIKARENGADVVLVDKGFAGKSGASSMAEGDLAAFRASKNHKLEEWLSMLNSDCQYLNNPEWSALCLLDSEARCSDLESYGVEFVKNEDGSPYVFSLAFDSDHSANVYQNVTMTQHQFAQTLRDHCLEIGVRIIDRVMITDLLTQDSACVGAAGFHTRSGNVFAFEASAVIAAAGSFSLRILGWCVDTWTADMSMAAYRCGARLTGFEFIESGQILRTDYEERMQAPAVSDVLERGNRANALHPRAINVGFTGWYDDPTVDAEGNAVMYAPWSAHEGKAPVFVDMGAYPPEYREWLHEYERRIKVRQGEKVGWDLGELIESDELLEYPGARIGRHGFAGGSGIWAADKDCSTDIPGLYAAGNNLGSMASGAEYAGMGWGLNHAAVTGSRAGEAAARRSREVPARKVPSEVVDAALARICAPLERKGGFSPAWASQLLFSITTPYFVFDVKSDARLRAALELVSFMREHISPMIWARNPHDLRKAHEAKNMILTAEMILRASLMRTESRGSHIREDYPLRDDPNWLAWILIRNDNGQMVLDKQPIPEKFWPDLSIPYKKRYPGVLPQEEVLDQEGGGLQ